MYLYSENTPERSCKRIGRQELYESQVDLGLFLLSEGKQLKVPGGGSRP
jgi:hypothetical protein